MGSYLKGGYGILVVALLVCAGCPLFQQSYQFTNADLYQNGYSNGTFGAVPASGTTDTTGASAAAREVVEPDVIRQNGSILYILNQYRGLTLVDLGGAKATAIPQPKILAQVPTLGYPRDLYVQDNRAYVIVGYATDYKEDGNKITYSVASKLYVVDITGAANAAIIGQFALDGDLVDSRLVGDVLYAVCAQYQYSWDTTTTGGGGVAVGSMPPVVKAATSSSWVTSINIADPSNIYKAGELSFDGYGSVIQATNSAIFVVAQPQWSDMGQSDNQSTITYVDISDPAGAISVRDKKMTVPGGVTDKFKLDVSDNVLRVVSSDWGWGTSRLVHLTTFDLTSSDFKQLGQTNLDDAIGETAFATRFDGPRAYIVTYLMKDPLFVADLSDPTAPKILGKLVMPGWLTYIEPQGNRLIALGVDDTNGHRVACSMFDVSDAANPKMIGNRVTFGQDWSWSTAYDDVKAFTVLDTVLIVPFSGWSANNSEYNRLQFISYSDTGLVGRGYVDVSGQILRSFNFNNAYYGVTTEQLAAIDGSDLDHPAVVNSTMLAECVSDFLELAPGLGAEIVTSYDTGKLIVETVSLEKALGEVQVDIGSLVKAYAAGTSVILVGTTWDPTANQAYYQVATVDCSNPTAPAATTFKVDVTPYYGGYYWFGYPEVMYAVGSVNMGVAMPMPYYWQPWSPQDITFLFGNTLALRCTSPAYDTSFGNVAPTQGIALVDIPSQKYSKAGLGYDNVVSMNAVAGKLVIGTKTGGNIYNGPIPVTGVSSPGAMPATPVAAKANEPTCAYFLQLLDVSALAMGPAANVPGLFVQYDLAKQLLVVRDDQWAADGSVTSNLRTLTWDGALRVQPLHQLPLPANAATIKGRGAKVYFDVYNNGYTLYAASVGDDGAMTASPGILVTDQYASLLDANPTTAYVAIGNAVATYDFSNGGAFKNLYPSMGYPQSIRFGATNAYVSFGYAGYAILPL